MILVIVKSQVKLNECTTLLLKVWNQGALSLLWADMQCEKNIPSTHPAYMGRATESDQRDKDLIPIKDMILENCKVKMMS